MKKNKCIHNWIFDFHYSDTRYVTKDYAETAVYHCNKCGEVQRVPVWIDKYEKKE